MNLWPSAEERPVLDPVNYWPIRCDLGLGTAVFDGNDLVFLSDPASGQFSPGSTPFTLDFHDYPDGPLDHVQLGFLTESGDTMPIEDLTAIVTSDRTYFDYPSEPTVTSFAWQADVGLLEIVIGNSSVFEVNRYLVDDPAAYQLVYAAGGVWALQWTGDAWQATRYDAATGSVEATVDLSELSDVLSWVPAMATDGRTLWVVSYPHNFALVFDVETGESVIFDPKVGPELPLTGTVFQTPYLRFDGYYMWVGLRTTSGGGRLVGFEGVNFAPIAGPTIGLPFEPSRVLFDGSTFWLLGPALAPIQDWRVAQVGLDGRLLRFSAVEGLSGTQPDSHGAIGFDGETVFVIVSDYTDCYVQRFP
jgi:hypothetical protein